MSQFEVRIESITTNGPYMYVIDKDGAGMKAAIGLASISAALDAVKADIGANLGGQTVRNVGMNVTTS